MLITSILENPLDLSIAEVVRHGDTQLLIVSTITPARMMLAAIAGTVALYFLWQIRRGFLEAGWFGIFPGILIAPVFAIVALVFFFAHHEKAFLPKERRAIVRGGMFGLSARREYPLPLNGRVSITLRRTLNRTEGQVAQSQSHYDISVESVPAMGLTVAGDRVRAQEVAKELAAFLAYELVDRSADLPR